MNLGAADAQNEQTRRPWLRLWLAFTAINLLFAPVSMLMWVMANVQSPFVAGPVTIVFGALTLALQGLQRALFEGADPMIGLVIGGLIGASLVQTIVLAPLWFLLARRAAWRRGVSDYWSAVLAVGFIYLIGVALVIASVFVGRDTRGDGAVESGVFLASFIVAMLSPPVGGVIGGALAQMIARAPRVVVNPSRVAPVASLDVNTIATVTTTRDLSVAVRVRERLALINGLIGGIVAVPALVMLVMFLIFIVWAPFQIFSNDPKGAWEIARPFVTAGLVFAIGIAFSVPASWIGRIHRRALALLGFSACLAIIGYALWRVRRLALSPASSEVESVRDELVFTLAQAASLTVIVYGLLAATFVGLLLAPRADFAAGLGWRPSVRRWIDNGRRMLGMPNYVSSLGRKQVAPTVLFLLSLTFSSLFIATPFLVSSPFGPVGLQAFSIPAQVELSIGVARAACGRADEETFRTVLQSPDATWPANMPLDRCTRIMAERSAPGAWLTPLLMVSVAAAFALIGLAFGRAGLRAATRAYQNVRDWDERAPIVFLRAFRADDARAPSAPHGLLQRFALRPGQPRTLDEIVLDAASPYGPVIAIGRPDEELPPLGAARIYARDGDWQGTVMGLCDAAACIVICADASEGVQWELQQILAKGHAAKTIVLISPQLKRNDRRLLAQKLLAMQVTRGDPIGAFSNADGALIALTSKRTSRAAYAVGLTISLDALLGEPAPAQPKGLMPPPRATD